MNSLTVGEIAAATPAAIGVFEKYGIDYCCGGGRPLAEACRERGIPAEQVQAELDRAAGGGARAAAAADWTTAPLSALIAHIVKTHHGYLRQELPRLSQRLAKVVEVHGHKYPNSLRPLQEVFDGVAAELEVHTRKEEMILFPAIERMEEAQASGSGRFSLPFGTVANPIRMMMHEHDSAGSALSEMRRLTGDYRLPEDACITYRALFQGLQDLEADLHRHIHLENNILFPRAVELEAVL